MQMLLAFLGLASLALVTLVPATAMAKSAAEELAEFCDIAEVLPPVGTSTPRIQILYGQVVQAFPLAESVKIVFDHDREYYIPMVQQCADGIRILIMNKQFEGDIIKAEPGGSSYWKWLFIFYHELAHALLHHDISAPCAASGELDPRVRTRRSLELEADYWAAFKLAQAGANEEETIAALNAMAVMERIEKGSGPCYPDLDDERMTRARHGWHQHVPLIATSTDPDVLGKFEVKDGYDIDGMDLYSLQTISSRQCAAICLKRSARCAAFSYDKKKQHCYLKHGPVGPNGAKNFRGFSPEDQILRFEPFSVTGFPNKSANSLFSVTKVPSTIRHPEQNDETCMLFYVSDIGKELYAKSYDSTQRDGSTTFKAWDDTCKARCRGEPRCNAYYSDAKHCRFYETLSGSFPASETGALITVRRFAYDEACKGLNK